MARIGAVDPGKRGLERSPGCEKLAVVEADTVNVVVAAAPPDGVTVEGIKLQVTPAGSPEQLKLVAPAKPFCGVTEMVTVPD